MSSARKINILVHALDPWSGDQYPFLGYLANAWTASGIEVAVVKGPDPELPTSDLLFAHVDLTVTPPAYVEYLRRFPRVVNGRVHDISKRAISSNLLTPRDAYQGRVIVKTNMNYGGIPELMLDAASGRNAMHHGSVQRPWRKVETLDPEAYPVFERLQDVPPGVWHNPHLVVEKFLPEIDGDLFCMRVALFMGDRVRCGRSWSRSPIVKGASIVRSEPIETPAGFKAVRERFGIDYGKIDYVEHAGRIQVIDVNKTPGGLRDREINARLGGLLADGVLPWLDAA
jgi:hypothetical protein